MPGFLDSLRQMQFNRTFANAGQPYNDMLGRYGNQLPPNPGPGAMPNNMGDGFLDGLMMQHQGAMVPPTGLSPAEAQASEVRAPQPQMGFLDRLQSSVEDNRGMLMGLGSGLLSRGWAGVGDAMPGMEYDENRRATEEQQAQMEAQRAAQMRLGEQYGVDPLMFEAGMGDFALQQALTPGQSAETFRPMSIEEAQSFGIEDPAGYAIGANGLPQLIDGTDAASNGGGTIPAELAGRLAAAEVALEGLEGARAALLDEDFTVGERAQSLLGGEVAMFETDFNAGQRNVRLAVESALRMMTGAAAPQTEVENYTSMFMPLATDPLRVRQQKLQLLEDFITRSRDIAMQGRGGAQSVDRASATTQTTDNDPLGIRGGM